MVTVIHQVPFFLFMWVTLEPASNLFQLLLQVVLMVLETGRTGLTS